MNVDEALQEADEARSGLHIISPTASLVTLAAEVRLLREELAMSKPLFSRRQLEAKLARVEALPARWRNAFCDSAYADDLEAALRGE